MKSKMKLQQNSFLATAGEMCGLAALFLFSSLLTAQAGTLDEVRKRGVLNCGVNANLKGFSEQGKDKKWSGFDVDYCRAVSAAIFGDTDKVKYIPLSSTERFKALQDKKIDVLSRNTTWTMSRDVDLGLTFIGVNYYDGQGFMTRRNYGLSSALQLVRASICVLEGTTSEDNATRYFSSRQLKVTIKKFKERKDLLKAYEEEKCDTFSGDRSALASDRLSLKTPEEHQLLPEVISKEPLGPVVRDDDAQWTDLTRWVLFLLINAEEAGWSQDSAGSNKAMPAVIQITPGINKKLGLKDDWAVNVIKSVGNYGEIFERHIGENSSLKLTRGVNALWSKGGFLYAPPMR